jgi:hypothetical protein
VRKSRCGVAGDRRVNKAIGQIQKFLITKEIYQGILRYQILHRFYQLILLITLSILSHAAELRIPISLIFETKNSVKYCETLSVGRYKKKFIM